MNESSLDLLRAVIIGTSVLVMLGLGLIAAIVFSQRKQLGLQRTMLGEIANREEKYRNLFENSLAGMIRWSLKDRTVLDANAALLRMFGVASVQELNVKVKAVNEADVQRLRQILLDEGRIENFEVQVRTQEGKLLWISFSGKLNRDEGIVEGVIVDSTVRRQAEEGLRRANEELDLRVKDRTRDLRLANEELKFELGERWRAEERLRELNELLEEKVEDRTRQLADANEELHRSKEHYRSLVENINEIYYVSDRSGKLVYASPNLFLRSGYSERELLGQSYIRLIHETDRKRVVDFYVEQSMAGTVDMTCEFRARLRDGSPVWVEQSTRVVRNGNGSIVEYRNVARDVSERKRAEDAILRARENYRSIFENAVEGIYQSRADGGYLSVNPALARIYGYESAEEMMRLVVDIGRQIYVDPLKREEFMMHLRNGGKVQGFEYEAYRKDGSKIWVSSNARVVFDTQKGESFYEGTIEDITDRKLIEEATREHTRRIIEAQETERKRVSRDLHDSVNQLLSSVKFRLQSVESNVTGRNKALRKEALETRNLLEQAIQEVRRISQNLRPSVLDDLGLLAAVRSTCNEFQSRTGIGVEVVARDVPKRLPAEIEVTLYRIIQEGLNNIEKHSQATAAHLWLRRIDSSVQAVIKDNGTGFDAKRPRTNGKARGGLGLVGMKERVSFVGGALIVSSEAGHGTEIEVRIPLRREYPL